MTLQKINSETPPIREAVPGDVQQMLELWRCFWPAQQYEANLTRKIREDGELVLIAEWEGRIIGTIIGGYDNWWAWIYRAAVHPNHQRRGIGASLFTEIHRRLRKRGAYAACLITSPENEGMSHLLDKLGYRERPDRRFSLVFDANPQTP